MMYESSLRQCYITMTTTNDNADSNDGNDNDNDNADSNDHSDNNNDTALGFPPLSDHTLSCAGGLEPNGTSGSPAEGSDGGVVEAH